MTILDALQFLTPSSISFRGLNQTKSDLIVLLRQPKEFQRVRLKGY
jgi:hypothetical protein